MADTAVTETSALSLSARVADWHWKWVLLASGATFVALLIVAFNLHPASSGALAPRGGRGFFSSGSHFRVDVVLAIVAAYTLGVGLLGLSKAPRELERLRPMLRLDECGWRALRGRLLPSTRAVATAALIGAPVGATLDLLPSLVLMVRPTEHSLHAIPTMMLLFALLAIQSLVTVRQSQVFYEAGRHHLALDLLDLGSLAPFVAIGLSNTAAWFIGSGLALFLVASSANPWVVVAVTMATFGMGVAALFLPSRGLHHCIRDHKRAELERVRSAIAIERADLLADDREASGAPRMASLLAYEERIEGVREWPFDTSTLRRFGLFLLIPLASWIGGALVERMVDAALG